MIRKKLVDLVVIALFLLATAGAASAASLDLPKWVIVPEDSSFSDVTLFCGLDAYDASTNTTPCYYQGNLTNAQITFDNGYPKLVQGKIGNAFEFGQGTNSYVTLQGNDMTLTEATIVGWIYPEASVDGDSYQSAILDVFENGGSNFIILYWRGSGFNFVVYNSTTYSPWVLTPADPGKWYFVVGIFDRGVIRMLVYDKSGKLIDKVASADFTEVQISNPTLRIGAQIRSGVSTAPVKIDEVRFYTRVLSDDEIKLLYLAGRKKLSEPANFRQIFSPMIDLTRDKTTFYAGLEVSTSDPSGYVPVPESAVNMSITTAEKLKSDYTGHDFYYQGHYWYRADKIQFNLPIQFETLREKNSFAKEILLDDDSKTFIYEKEFRVTNPTATKINVLYTVDPTTLGFSVLQYPQFELDGVPMAEWRPSNSTSLYLIRTDSLEPGEISTHWMKSIWTITKEELEFPAKLDDFRSITTFEQARKLAENAIEGKTDTYVKVIKIDSNADVSNVTILVPLKDVEDKNDVIEAVALTGSRETLQVEELPDGKIVVKVPSEAFVSGHAEIKVLYNKEGKSGIFAIISKILAKIKELLRKLGLGGLIFWPVSHA